MKKRIMLLMVLTAAVLAGCSGKAGAADQTKSSAATETSAEETKTDEGTAEGTAETKTDAGTADVRPDYRREFSVSGEVRLL